ncbi:hydroxyacylglutathione hydrolase [Paracoccus pacificus]|uniref:Hydroxyacylglutathione hydrolase n=1 Tax=Paracoccus pacificus TaxID=1463598 RepID=A0ABW4R962_9RHOB
MALELLTIRCLNDNYAYLIHDADKNETALIDAPEAAPILAALADRGWKLDQILLTHHHADHTQAVAELVAATGASVTGARADAHRLPPLDHQVSPGDTVRVGGSTAEIIDVPGHTVGHIAFHFPDDQLAFTADSLMAMGCGRLFEGTADQMWDSLSRLAGLPAETMICSGHDYCRGNGAFAISVDPQNPALRERIAQTADGLCPCAPATLAVELATNPFLRASDPAIRANLGMENAGDAEVFAELRRRKDAF